MSEHDRSVKPEGPTTAAVAPEAPTSSPGHGLALRRKIQRRALQRKLDSESAAPAAMHAAADAGTQGAGGALPHGDAIQKSFGNHDVSGIAAHTGPDAQAAAQSMGAEAFATGNDVAFAGAPSLHTAAHEAAHVVQQREGVHLKGGIGEEGDAHEKHADAVADAVVAGKSAEGLLTAGPSGGGGGAAVQHKLTGFGSLPAEVKSVKTAIANYDAAYDIANPTNNIKLLDAISAAVASTGRSYQLYVQELKPAIAKELREERARIPKPPVTPTTPPTPPSHGASSATPTPGANATPTVTTPPSHPVTTPTVAPTASHPASSTVTPASGAVTATAPVGGVAPVGPKPATGDVVGFEQSLGLEALKDARSMGAVDGLMTKVMHCLEVRARMMDKTAAEVETKKATLDTLLTQFVGSDNKGVAGAAGLNADVLRHTMARGTGGTIREKMTVLFNFAGKFQDFILGSSDADRDAFLAKATINGDAIRARIQKLKDGGATTGEGGKFDKVTGHGGRQSFPPLTDTGAAEKQQGGARAPRAEGEAPAHTNPTVGALGANKETALGQGELDTMFPTKIGADGHVDREAVKNDAVTWRLGVNQWKEKEGSTFVADLKALNLPFGAGPSGTTARIFSTAELIACPKDHLLRMACIGYLVPIHAHSLLEVVAGAKTHGVAAPDFQTLGAEVYEQITPFDPMRIKALKTQHGMDPPK